MMAFFAIFICIAYVLFCGCTSSSSTDNPTYNFTTLTPGKLSVVTGTAFPPFVWINTSESDPQGRYNGFEIDLMREIAKELNCSVEFTSQPFSTMITAIQAKQFDCAVDGFSITGERQTRVAFSDPYYMVQQSILARANDGSITSPADLRAKNKTVVAGQGTTGMNVTKNELGIDQDHIKVYGHIKDAFPELQIGAVDAIVVDYPTASYYYDAYPGSFKFVGELFPQKEPYAIVMNKENTGLTAAINKALAKIRADGRYEALLEKYHLKYQSP
jgi:ABC-type amino acid transport substrate-binding protein